MRKIILVILAVFMVGCGSDTSVSKVDVSSIDGLMKTTMKIKGKEYPLLGLSKTKGYVKFNFQVLADNNITNEEFDKILDSIYELSVKWGNYCTVGDKTKIEDVCGGGSYNFLAFGPPNGSAIFDTDHIKKAKAIYNRDITKVLTKEKFDRHRDFLYHSLANCKKFGCPIK